MKYFEKIIFDKKIYITLNNDSISRTKYELLKSIREIQANMLHTAPSSIVMACIVDDKIKFFYGNINLIKKLEEDTTLNINWKNI